MPHNKKTFLLLFSTFVVVYFDIMKKCNQQCLYFRVFDEDGSGSLDFLEFTLALNCTSLNNPEDKLRKNIIFLIRLKSTLITEITIFDKIIGFSSYASSKKVFSSYKNTVI